MDLPSRQKPVTRNFCFHPSQWRKVTHRRVTVGEGLSWPVMMEEGLSWSVTVEQGLCWSVTMEELLSWPHTVEQGLSWSVTVEELLSWPHTVEQGLCWSVTVEEGLSWSVMVEELLSSPVTVVEGNPSTRYGGGRFVFTRQGWRIVLTRPHGGGERGLFVALYYWNITHTSFLFGTWQQHGK